MSRSWSWTVGSRYTESWRARSLRVPRGSVGVSRWTTFQRGGADASMIERRLCLSCFDIFLALRSPVADEVGALSRGVPYAPLEPGPEPADLVGRLPARIELGHALAHAERGKPVGGVADAVAARRRLVEDEGELLVEAVDRRERRLEGAKVGRRRPAWNEAQVGGPDRRERAGAVDARRVDEH